MIRWLRVDIREPLELGRSREQVGREARDLAG